MRKQIVCTLSFFIPLLSLHAADRQAALVMNILAPKEYGEMKLNRYADSFSLSIDNKEKQIPNYMVSKPLRQMKPEQLAAFLQTNYLTLTECSDGQLSLQEHGRVKGGAWGGAIGGYLTGEVVARCAILIGGTVVLHVTMGAVGFFAGQEAKAEFRDNMVDRFQPGLEVVADRAGHILGAVLGVVGAATPV